jgi:hypothetical protein
MFETEKKTKRFICRLRTSQQPKFVPNISNRRKMFINSLIITE